jgi:hypothetical protein
MHLDALAAIEQNPNCEIAHASVQEGHALSIIVSLLSQIRGPRSRV